MTNNLLGDARWECASSDPGNVDAPVDLQQAGLAWIAADVPGTAAGALRAAGQWHWGVPDNDVLDGRDWWFRCRFSAAGDGPWRLNLDGLATIADVWLNGEHLLASTNMFVEHECAIEQLAADNELCIRFAALTPVLGKRRPRPRWKSTRIRHQNLRWLRTTLLGRMDGWAAWAAPVGPWRPISLVRADPTRVVLESVDAQCAGAGGTITVRARVDVTGDLPTRVQLRVGDITAPLAVTHDESHTVVEGTLHLPVVERWWPHTHGAQPRYPVLLEIDGARFELTSVGFRTVVVDAREGGFAFVVNDIPVFCRGAIWVPPDIVTHTATADALRASLELFRATGMNMVRVGGYGTYETPAFWDLCDELGLLVWQDCMLASVDPPDDDAFVADLDHELTQVLRNLQGRPALALVCGSNESYQQAALFGLDCDTWNTRVLEEAVPAAVARTVPGTPYIASSPIGGDLPFDPSVGVAHYYGAGAYLRPISDARRAAVRFAAECLAFSIPPERAGIEETFGSRGAAHTPAWKNGVPRDAGSSWDFEDVRDFYVHELFGRDANEVRYADPDWALDLGRAAVAEVMTGVMAEWRRPGSRNAGGIVLAWADLWPGAGWGLVDAAGRPKAPAYALRHVLDPLAVLLSDEGLAGLQIHVVNDRPQAFSGQLRLEVFADSGLRIEHVEVPFEVAAHGARSASATALLGGFRDLTRAYRFGPPEHDVARVTLVSDRDGSERDAFFLPLGSGRPRISDVGLTANATRVDQHEWSLTVATRLFAQWVALDVRGFTVSDSWFHLAPGAAREIRLRTPDAGATPAGDVRALNSRASTLLVVREA